MGLRLLIALAASFAMAGSWWLVRRRQLSATPRLAPGTPGIVYFWSRDCAPCRTMQAPVLRRLTGEAGVGLRVVDYDAVNQPELARRWRVVSVPTTFVVDAAGRPRFVNNGVADEQKLRRQLASLTGAPVAG